MPLWTTTTGTLDPNECPVCFQVSPWVMLSWNTEDQPSGVVGTATCRHFTGEHKIWTIMPYGEREVPPTEIESFKDRWYDVTETMLPGV
jgi:hypothetical protein